METEIHIVTGFTLICLVGACFSKSPLKLPDALVLSALILSSTLLNIALHSGIVS